MQIIKNLKPYWKSVLIIVLLLIVQAYCDLALPDYTSKLIDTGIQNYGIDHCSPLQIPEKAYTIIKGFMDEDDVTVWEKYYEQSDDGIYHMTDDGKDHIDEIDQACMEPMMMYYYPYTMVDSDEDNQLKQMLAASGMTLDELPPEMWSQMGTQMKQMIDSMRDSMGDDMMMSSAITCTRTCYDSMDYNYKDIQMSYLKRVGVEMILMTLLMVASAILTGLVAARVAAGVGCDLRESIFKRVISFSDAEINRFSTASLITRSTNDVQQIQMVTVMLLRMVLYAPVLAVGGIIKVVESGASMGWVIVVAVAGILVVLGVLMAIALPKFKIMQDLVDRVNLVSREILTGIPVIRAFGREKFEEERFDKANKDLTKTSLFVNRVMTFMMPVLMFIMYAVTILIEWVAAHRIDSGELQVGSMTAFITYTMMIIMSFLMIGMLSVMLPRAGVAADRIKEVIDTESTICDKPDCKKLEAVKGVVRYEHVSFAYPEAGENVITDISFKAEKGETVAIIGSTGSGKSTLINLIPRFYDATEGAVKVDGVDVREMTQKDVRDRIGYVPQKGVLFSGTIDSNIRYGKTEIPEDAVKKAAEVAQATEFIDTKPERYKSPIAQGGSNVSGGQKQRLSIARAIAKDPEIFIFDDSFSALDLKTDAALRKALGEQVQDSTMIIVAQRISTILHADQILVLEEGKIVGKGTHEELLRSCEVYQQIAKSQLSAAELGLEEDTQKGAVTDGE